MDQSNQQFKMMFMHIITYRSICLRIHHITLFQLVISQCLPFQHFIQYSFIFFLLTQRYEASLRGSKGAVVQVRACSEDPRN